MAALTVRTATGPTHASSSRTALSHLHAEHAGETEQQMAEDGERPCGERAPGLVRSPSVPQAPRQQTALPAQPRGTAIILGINDADTARENCPPVRTSTVAVLAATGCQSRIGHEPASIAWETVWPFLARFLVLELCEEGSGEGPCSTVSRQRAGMRVQVPLGICSKAFARNCGRCQQPRTASSVAPGLRDSRHSPGPRLCRRSPGAHVRSTPGLEKHRAERRSPPP